VAVSSVPSDPFSLREGVKSEGELSELRKRRKTGKKLENFHRKQNDVRYLSVGCRLTGLDSQLGSSFNTY
jgi:hypothetical protein